MRPRHEEAFITLVLYSWKGSAVFLFILLVVIKDYESAFDAV